MRTLIVTLGLVLSTPALAVDVNAPLDTRPTVQTEMHRGFLAASHCEITLPPLDYEVCIDHVSDAEEAKISNADAFDLGLYLAAWDRLDLKMRSSASLPDNPFAQADLPESRRGAASEFLVLRGLQKKLGLTDQQVRGAAEGLHDGLADHWNFWLAQPYGEMAKP